MPDLEDEEGEKEAEAEEPKVETGAAHKIEEVS